MLNNTRATFDKILVDFKRFSYYTGILLNSVYIFSMIYAIVSDRGSLVLNIVMLAAAVGYLVFYLFTFWKNEKVNKSQKKKIKRIYRFAKLIMSFVSLTITVYGLYIAAENVTLISLLLATMSVISWIFGATTAFIIEFIESRKNMIVTALAMDFEPITKPVSNITNAVRMITGKEPQEPKTVSEAMERKIDKIRNKFLEKRKAEKNKTTENKS